MFATPSLGKLRALTGAQRRLLVEAALLLPLVAAVLRLAGLRATRRLLERYAGGFGTPAQMEPAGVARMVAVAARQGLVRPSCLPSALTLEALLRRRGWAPELRLGVRKHDGGFQAHAWIEHDGIALMEPFRRHMGFIAFESLPARR